MDPKSPPGPSEKSRYAIHARAELLPLPGTKSLLLAISYSHPHLRCSEKPVYGKGGCLASAVAAGIAQKALTAREQTSSVFSNVYFLPRIVFRGIVFTVSAMAAAQNVQLGGVGSVAASPMLPAQGKVLGV